MRLRRHPFAQKHPFVVSATPTADEAPVFGDSARQLQGEACRDQGRISRGAPWDSLPRLSKTNCFLIIMVIVAGAMVVVLPHL